MPNFRTLTTGFIKQMQCIDIKQPQNYAAGIRGHYTTNLQIVLDTQKKSLLKSSHSKNYLPNCAKQNIHRSSPSLEIRSSSGFSLFSVLASRNILLSYAIRGPVRAAKLLPFGKTHDFKFK